MATRSQSRSASSRVVGGEQDRAATRAEALDQLPELSAGLRIEPGGGLVEKEELGVADQRAGEREPLPLTSRELADARPRLLAELDQVDDFAGLGAARIEAPEQPDRLGDRELLGELGLLERDSEQLAELPIIGAPAPAEDYDLAGVRLGEALADLDGSGLAGTVGSQEAEALARTDLEVEAVDRDDVTEGFAELAEDEGGVDWASRHAGSLTGAGGAGLLPRTPLPHLAHRLPHAGPFLGLGQQQVAGEHAAHVDGGLCKRGGVAGEEDVQHGDGYLEIVVWIIWASSARCTRSRASLRCARV